MADEPSTERDAAGLQSTDILQHVKRVLGELSTDAIRGRVRAELQSALGSDVIPLRTALASVETLAASLRTEAERGEEVRAGLRSLQDKARRDDVRTIASQAITPLSDGLRLEVDAVRRRLEDDHARLAALADRTTDAHLERLVDEAARRIGESLFSTRFASSVEEFQRAFENADDRFTQFRQIIDHAGPGGAPVLRQANDELRRQLELVSADLEKERETARQRSEDLAKKEAELIQKSFAAGLPTLEEIDERRRDLERREREVRDRVSLESEIQRLASQVQNVQRENEEWRQKQFAAQQSEFHTASTSPCRA